MYKEIIISVLSAVAGAVLQRGISFLKDRRKEIRENSKETLQRKRELYENRPEMEVIHFKDYSERTNYGIKHPCDLELFAAKVTKITEARVKIRLKLLVDYSQSILGSAEWCCVIYSFKNVGKSSVLQMDIISRFPTVVSVFPANDIALFYDYHLLNSSCLFDKKIRPGQTVSVKICFLNGSAPQSPLSAVFYIGMIDDCGNHWIQPLFAPSDKVYDSRSVTAGEYNALIHAGEK